MINLNHPYCYPYTNEITNYVKIFEPTTLLSMSKLFIYNNQPYGVMLNIKELIADGLEISYPIPQDTEKHVFSSPLHDTTGVELSYFDPRGRKFVKIVGQLYGDTTIYTNHFRRIN